MLQRLEVLDGKIGFIHVALALLAASASRLALKQWALPRIAELAKNKAYFTDQGIPWLFDGRKRGYSLVDAKMHLEALGYAARDYYATWYIPVYDLVFPVTLFVFGTLFCIWITQPGPGFAVSMHPRWRLTILVVPLALFVFDMLENLAPEAPRVLRAVSLRPTQPRSSAEPGTPPSSSSSTTTLRPLVIPLQRDLARTHGSTSCRLAFSAYRPTSPSRLSVSRSS